MRAALVLAGLVCCAFPASSSELVEGARLIVAECGNAISAENRQQAGVVSARIAKMATMAANTGELDADLAAIFSSDEAEACLSYARQADLEFSVELGRYISRIVRRQEELARQQAIGEEEMRKLAERQAEAQKQLELKINLEVYAACSVLLANDRIAAFTNDLCVSSFKANGLPE